MIQKSFNTILLVVSFLALFISYKNRPLKIGVVDLNFIISMRSQELAKQKASSQKIKNEVQKIKKMILNFGEKNHLLLFAKGSIFKHNIKDYTDEILS
jgi:hypothetical protein